MDPQETETWALALARFRRDKHEFFRAGESSPLPHEERERFSGLRYFDTAPSFRFGGARRRNPAPASVRLVTIKGTRQLFSRVGYFETKADGVSVRVQAYQSAERDDPSIFVPFRDGTSGKESYGAARYLDLEVEHDDNYVLDFNYAYNPYCAYSEEYVCPLPPQENWLKLPVAAGERKYHE